MCYTFSSSRYTSGMRILFLTKRQYTSKDLIDDRFGRLREIPLSMAEAGHKIEGVCLSYKNKPDSKIVDSGNQGYVTWHSINAGFFKLPGLIRYILKTRNVIRNFRPEVIVAASDSIYGILGTGFGKLFRLPCVFDLYDNFESFAAIRIPGILPLYRRAIIQSAGITCVSNPLADYIMSRYRPSGTVITLENGLSNNIFYPRDKVKCRRDLGLPQNVKIIGVAGALSRTRGINTLIDAFNELHSRDNDLHLVLSGYLDKDVGIPSSPNIHYLGMLPLEKVPAVLCSLDVAVIGNRDTAFGRYCFPQKTYEILACRVPLVAAKIGSMKELLWQYSELLYTPDDTNDLVRALSLQLAKTIVPNIDPLTWDEVANRLILMLTTITASQDDTSREQL